VPARRLLMALFAPLTCGLVVRSGTTAAETAESAETRLSGSAYFAVIAAVVG
jgi:hypothetical protein